MLRHFGGMPAEGRGFDGSQLYAALDARRAEAGLSWRGVARQIWDLSAGLNAKRSGDHPFSTSSTARLREAGNTSCQHALLMLWWLGAAPEEFVTDPARGTTGMPLPACDSGHRLRWSLKRLHATLNEARIRREATWSQTAAHLGCTASQLTGLRTARYATNMRLAMAITQALRRPAADFIYAAHCSFAAEGREATRGRDGPLGVGAA